MTTRGSKTLIHTLEKIGCKPRLVDGTVRHKLHPQSVGAGFHILRLLIATEVANQGAVFRGAIPDLQVVIGAAVMPFDLKGETETVCMAAQTAGLHGVRLENEASRSPTLTS